jgi:predicted nucleic-acid-binding protein
MIAVDTNVLVRLLTGDEPKQAAAARSLFASERIWIAKTVLLETGWVLRSLYGFEESAIHDAFTKLLGLKNVHTEDESSVAAALALTTHGIELADALHSTSRPPEAVLVSFDKSFIRRARRARVSGISTISIKD